jgi:tight adherence protein C
MPIELMVAMATVAVAVALFTGTLASAVLARSALGRRRLEQLVTGSTPRGSARELRLTDAADPRLQRLTTIIPRSPKEMNRIQRRLARAGLYSPNAAILYCVAEVVSPLAFGLATWAAFGSATGIAPAAIAAVVGFVLPSFVVARMTVKRQKQIQNGLPDALDLLIVCVEAGSSLDQALMKASDELEIAYPALTGELRLITTEIRAGRGRLEAFKNFAERTKVDDVRALVAMLVQTDRFGTSIAQALRTHADTSRTKRRQRAEERAAKLGVKLVFPLVFFLFPALYIVLLGPAVIKILRVFVQQVAPGN